MCPKQYLEASHPYSPVFSGTWSNAGHQSPIPCRAQASVPYGHICAVPCPMSAYDDVRRRLSSADTKNKTDQPRGMADPIYVATSTGI